MNAPDVGLADEPRARPWEPVPATLDDQPDDVLIRRVRDGDHRAFATLYVRHAAAARRLAEYHARGPADAEDLVAEAFTRVYDVLRRGTGPHLAFRSYLLTVLRRLAADGARRQRDLELVPEVDDLAGHRAEPYVDVVMEQLEQSYAARAYARLPERWQTVLWHTQIEGASPAEVAPLLGMSASAVSALAYRAREGLREAYLQVHVLDRPDASCRETLGHLGAYARGRLRRPHRLRVEAHLAGCKACRRAVAELADVNATLRSWVAPLVLGPFAAHYLAGKATLGVKVLGIVGWLGPKLPQPGSGHGTGGGGGGVSGTAAASVALVAGVGVATVGVGGALDHVRTPPGDRGPATAVLDARKPGAGPVSRVSPRPAPSPTALTRAPASTTVVIPTRPGPGAVLVRPSRAAARPSPSASPSVAASGSPTPPIAAAPKPSSTPTPASTGSPAPASAPAPPGGMSPDAGPKPPATGPAPAPPPAPAAAPVPPATSPPPAATAPSTGPASTASQSGVTGAPTASQNGPTGTPPTASQSGPTGTPPTASQSGPTGVSPAADPSAALAVPTAVPTGTFDTTGPPTAETGSKHRSHKRETTRVHPRRHVLPAAGGAA